MLPRCQQQQQLQWAELPLHVTGSQMLSQILVSKRARHHNFNVFCFYARNKSETRWLSQHIYAYDVTRSWHSQTPPPAARSQAPIGGNRGQEDTMYGHHSVPATPVGRSPGEYVVMYVSASPVTPTYASYMARCTIAMAREE